MVDVGAEIKGLEFQSGLETWTTAASILFFFSNFMAVVQQRNHIRKKRWKGLFMNAYHALSRSLL